MSALWRMFLDVCPSCRATWLATRSIPTHTAAGLKFQGEQLLISDSWTGSRLFEVNIWMWQYGRPFPRKFSVEEAVAMQNKRVQESRARGAATRQRLRDAAASKMGVQEQWAWSTMTFEYLYRIRYRTRYIMQYDYDIEVTNYDIVLQNWPKILDTISKFRSADIEVHNLLYRQPTISFTRYRSSVPTIS